MRCIDLLEFAIYHWNYQKNITLPGLIEGLPRSDFFCGLQQIIDPFEIEFKINQCLDQEIINWGGFNNRNLILCSGGVDSSLLVASSTFQEINPKLLHTAYTNHPDNDLNKLINVLQTFSCSASIHTVEAEQYEKGLKVLWDNKFIQNTYAPTIAYALSKENLNLIDTLVTGSGPDELFYGMEKYDWNYFKNISEIPLVEALKKIDVAYNLNSYKKILNKEGFDLLENLQKQRGKLYKRISEIYNNIFDCQRLLAYCTVTSQHMNLFDGISNIYGIKHKAPYLNNSLIKLAFAIPIDLLLNPEIGNKVEKGKYQLKKFLSKYMPAKHAFSRKIGFHAPTIKFLNSKNFEKIIKGIEMDQLPDFIDKDKAKVFIQDKLDKKSQDDYFLYSILFLSKLK